MQITGKIAENVQRQSFGAVWNNKDFLSKLGEYTFPQPYLMNHLGELSQVSDILNKDVFIKVSENEDKNEIKLKALVMDTNDDFKTRVNFLKWDSSADSPVAWSKTIRKLDPTDIKKEYFLNYIKNLKKEIYEN